ncbi:hypothetical protein [Promicromonospora sp. MEB111]|uniref:hypothetical protein n=1 Tax=unclassified Promicromonospora TaxID=2647929 RepID=UPI00254E10B3|nr:hypothetical protein [Promicromonospora sp. MEB111]
MTQDRRTGTPVPGPRPGGDDRHDDLAERIAAALRSREPDAADTAAVALRIAARIEAADARSGLVTPFARRAGTIAVTGVVASALGMVGAGATAAANPYTDFAAAVDGVAHAVGVDWSSMPDGYTREQHDAFWDAGYSAEDQVELAELWSVDIIEVKARAGQMVLDGERLPFKPGTHTTSQPSAEEIASSQAFIDSGYTSEDLAALSALWNVDEMEAKVRAGEILLAGKPLPLP